jgi:hypothetical protein
VPSKVTHDSTDEEIEEALDQPTGFDEEAGTKTLRLRGVTYVLRELEISEIQKIERESIKTSTERGPDGEDHKIETPDPDLLDRMKIMKCLVHPTSGEPGYKPVPRLPSRVFLKLRYECNQLLYGEEIDELEAERAAKKGKKEEGDTKGN